VATSLKRRNFWRADWFVGVLVVLAVFIFNKSTNFVDALDNRLYDFGLTQANKKPSDQIAIIAIDDQSIQNIGRWPWSRDVQAKLIDQISSGKPKAIANSIFILSRNKSGLCPTLKRYVRPSRQKQLAQTQRLITSHALPQKPKQDWMQMHSWRLLWRRLATL
jgi:CHASE2 domain-containing sensor protein